MRSSSRCPGAYVVRFVIVATGISLVAASSREHQQSILAAEFSADGRLKAFKPHSSSFVRRQEADPKAASDPASKRLGSHSASNPAPVKINNTTVKPPAKKHQSLECPRDFVARKGYSRPNLCPTKLKKKTQCSWDDASTKLGEICGSDCFCEKPAAAKYLTVDTCKLMCKDLEKCYFTYTSSGGCRVYEGCNEPETPTPDQLANVSAWITCERFFENYTNMTVAFHSGHYNRYLQLSNKKGFPLRITPDEVSLADRQNVTSTMRFVISSTLNVDAVNAMTKSGPSFVGSKPRQSDVGGPGQVALFNNAFGKHPWIGINEKGNITGQEMVDGNAVWMILRQGPNQVSIYHPQNRRYLLMDQDSKMGVVASQEHDCCTPPEPLFQAVFSVVVPPPLTGHESKKNENMNDDALLFESKHSTDELAWHIR